MTVNFKLGPVTAVDPAQDDMSRTWIGWSPLHLDQETYDQNRGLWLLGRRVEHEQYATFSAEGIVRVVVAIDHVETVPSKVAGARSKRAIMGRVLKAGDPIYDALIDQQVDGHRNPVTYLEDPIGGPRTCACGCGAAVLGSRAFLPGHDQRAVHDRITRQWGSTLAFINWFDATYPEAA